MNNQELYKQNDIKVNKFNLITLWIVAILGTVIIIFNEVGIFTLNKHIVRTTMAISISFSLIPFFIFLIHDKLLKKQSTILGYNGFKIIILVSTFLSIIIICIALSFHATMILVLPTLLVAQYRSNKRILRASFIISLLSLVFVVYLTFLFGVYDANLLKPLTKEEATVFANRVNILTFKRGVEIFLHYVVPKIISVAAIDFIVIEIIKRNDEMLNKQIELSDKINEEILTITKMQSGVIEHLADIIESRDIETGEHIKRTRKYVSILVDKMKDDDRYKDYLTPIMCSNIINAAPLHDIGKITVSDLILRKPGRLTPEEFDLMKLHTTKGGEIIDNLLIELGDKEFLSVAHDIAIAHHEKWDGTGYPYGLKGEDIPLPGRIMAIADVFDALVAERVYKKPIPIDEAVDIIIQGAGTHFDPNIVEIFKTVIPEFKEIALADLSGYSEIRIKD